MNFLNFSSLLTAIFYVVTIQVTLFSPRAIAQSSFDTLDTGHDCLIEPYVIADVGSSTQGIVSRLLADRGATIKKGQAIAKLDSLMEEVAIEQAVTRAEMLGEIVTRQADLELARLDSERFSRLHTKGLAPAQQRDEAIAREKIANAALKQALEGQELLVLELKRSRRALAQRTIRSPVDGVVVNQLVFPGELVFDNPIMTVAQLDPLRVEVVLPARLFGTVKEGDTALVHTEIKTDEPLVAEVDVVDPLLDSRSGTFGVRLLLVNKNLEIPAGQKCRVTFQISEDDALVPVAGPDNRDAGEPESLGAAVPAEVEEPNSTDH